MRNSSMTTDRPTVSIVTPVLNGADTLAQCLRSVAEQGATVIEHVVVDGGSTDGSIELVQKWIETKVAPPTVRIMTGRDRGIADGFNKGIAATTGDWIGILNADDWYEPGIVGRLRTRMTRDVILHGRTRLHDPRTGASRESGPLEWIPEKHFRPREKMPAQHPTCFVPRSVYQRVGSFNLAFRLAMDYEFLLRAHLAGVPFEYVPEVITNIARGGASGRDPFRAQREVLAAQILHLNEVVGPVRLYGDVVRRYYLRRLRRRLLRRPF